MNGLSDETIVELWDMIFNISQNMLHDENDAKDATQTIFEKIIDKYSDFKGHSKLSTWAYRIAFNYLVDIKRSSSVSEISFEIFEHDVNIFTPYQNEFGLNREEEKIFAEEVKVGCTLAMLQCLDYESRFIYILGSIFNFTGKEASEICKMEPVTYRKKLSRAKLKINSFMGKNCGLINPDAICRCRKRILIAKERGRIDMEKLMYQTENRHIKDIIREMNEIDVISKVFQSNPYFENHDDEISRIKEKFKILQETQIKSINQEI